MVFGLSPDEATFRRRGFVAENDELRRHLEGIGGAFLAGYHAALAAGHPERLDGGLEPVAAGVRGFAYEGAAMAFALLDGLFPSAQGRWLRFAHGTGRAHIYMVHVGAGWAMARLPGRGLRSPPASEPLFRWLVLDGFGFHEGYFHGRRTLDRGLVPRSVRGYARRAFDQGLGRSLWFREAGDPLRIARAVGSISPRRRPDLWSGVGLACAYAGGVGATEMATLRLVGDGFSAALAQGAAFAAKARERAGNPAAHTEMACRVLCGMSAPDAAAVTDAALEGIPPDGPDPSYEVWRRRVRAILQSTGTVYR